MAEVVLSRRARKDLDALDPPVRNRILERLGDLEADPLRHAIRLTDTLLGTYRVRIGDWRVIFDLDTTRWWSCASDTGDRSTRAERAAARRCDRLLFRRLH